MSIGDLTRYADGAEQTRNRHLVCNPLLKNSGVFAALNLNLTPLSFIVHGRKITMASPSLLVICAIYLFFTFDER